MLLKKVTFHRHLLGEQGVSVLKLYGCRTTSDHVRKEKVKSIHVIVKVLKILHFINSKYKFFCFRFLKKQETVLKKKK